MELFEDKVPGKAPDGSDFMDLDILPLCDVCIDALLEEAYLEDYEGADHSCDNKKRSFWIECQCVCNPGTDQIRFLNVYSPLADSSVFAVLQLG